VGVVGVVTSFILTQQLLGIVLVEETFRAVEACATAFVNTASVGINSCIIDLTLDHGLIGMTNLGLA